jgi:hypothetical protein
MSTHPMIAGLMSTMEGMRSSAQRAPRNTWSQPSTPHQRLHIRTLMAQLDLDTARMTADFRRYFDAAGLPQPPADESVDAVLCGLTRQKASALAAALMKELPDA